MKNIEKSIWMNTLKKLFVCGNQSGWAPYSDCGDDSDLPEKQRMDRRWPLKQVAKWFPKPVIPGSWSKFSIIYGQVGTQHLSPNDELSALACHLLEIVRHSTKEKMKAICLSPFHGSKQRLGQTPDPNKVDRNQLDSLNGPSKAPSNPSKWISYWNTSVFICLPYVYRLCRHKERCLRIQVPIFSWSMKPPSTLRLVKSSQAIPSHLLRPHGEVLHLRILQLCVRFLRGVAPGLSIPSSRNHAGSGGWNHYWAVWTYNGGIRLLSIHVLPKSVGRSHILHWWRNSDRLARTFKFGNDLPGLSLVSKSQSLTRTSKLTIGWVDWAI